MNKELDILENAVEQHQVPEKKNSSALIEFLEQFEKEVVLEDKIRHAIHFMRAAISQIGTPRFKDFWEVRRLCLPLFKKNLNPKVRVLLWGEYIELSSEARRIKEILDEQSSFAAEQIELAITALEGDQEQFDRLLSQGLGLNIPDTCTILSRKKEFYSSSQKELNLLNTMASRINGLRKEVVKTEMRVRYKNKFFDRLSACGDRVFPRRKELIRQISEEFLEDVACFLAQNFEENNAKALPLFMLREEIKALQLMAKELTLNTQAFTETRLRLSKYWDTIRDLERERKKEYIQKKQSYKQNCDHLLEQIALFAEKCRAVEITPEEVNRQSEEIAELMRNHDLGRGEVKLLREELQKAKQIAFARFREKEQEKELRDKEEDRKRQERLNELRNQLQDLIQGIDDWEMQALTEKRDLVVLELERISLNRTEKQAIDRLLKQLKDQINEKKEKAIMALSPDDLQALGQLRSALEERKQQRQEIRQQLEHYRKALGGSGLDFEKAMTYSELVEVEKGRLEKANNAIQEIEEKISDVER